MCYIRWMLHLNCYTHGGLRTHRVITKQCMALCVTLDLDAQVSSQVDKKKIEHKTKLVTLFYSKSTVHSIDNKYPIIIVKNYPNGQKSPYYRLCVLSEFRNFSNVL